jgi:DNA polymerase-3 subunit epsilon
MSNLAILKQAYQRGNFVILDTETTGLERGEIVQIAIIDQTGQTLLDTLVKPNNPIPYSAQAIHGITDAIVADAPSWAEVSPKVQSLVQGKDLMVYNAVYDRKMLHQTAESNGMPKIQWREIAQWVCVMEAYAIYHGDWNDYHQSYRWQKLTDAATRLGIDRKHAHSALGDCLMTLGVINALAKIECWEVAKNA